MERRDKFLSPALAISVFIAVSVAAVSPPSAKADNPPPGASGIQFDPSNVTVTDLPVPPGLQDPAPPPPVTTPTATVPQVVTVPTTTSPAAVTTITTTTKVPAPKQAPPPYCLNHPDYVAPLPSRWYRTIDGNCYYRGEDNYGLCKGDEYQLAAYSSVDNLLKSGYGMGIIVDTPDPNYRLNCLISDVTTYRMDPKDFVFSGKYVQDGWPADFREFDTPLPYPWSDWKPLYPLWIRRATASQFVASQSDLSIRAYGLLWYNGNRYQTANSFAKYMRKSHTSWKTWKKANPAFATALVSHQRLLLRK